MKLTSLQISCASHKMVAGVESLQSTRQNTNTCNQNKPYMRLMSIITGILLTSGHPEFCFRKQIKIIK